MHAVPRYSLLMAMIEVLFRSDDRIEEFDVESFDRAVRQGLISSHDQMRWAVITGPVFVRCADVDYFKQIRPDESVVFQHNFNLARFPYLTIIVIVSLCATFFFFQRPASDNSFVLVERGAKSVDLMFELQQWWRLITTAWVHVSEFHVGVNVLFLLNLGGPAEAVFRRRDYALILMSSLLVSSGLSAWMNPVVSAGASGVVFGVWGALIVFGFKFRRILPPRYRRYFVYSVTPYALFALYIGFIMSNVDHFAHIGGVIGGALAAATMKPRLLCRPESPYRAGVLLVLPILLIGIASIYRGPHLTLREVPITGRFGLKFNAPQSWEQTISKSQPNIETRSFQNLAGVTFGIEMRRGTTFKSLNSGAMDFLDFEIAPEIENLSTMSFKLSDWSPCKLGGLAALCMNFSVPTAEGFLLNKIFFVQRGVYTYAMMLSIPSWLEQQYAQAFAPIFASISIDVPPSLTQAEAEYRERPFEQNAAQVYQEYLLAGLVNEAETLFNVAWTRWPNGGSLAYARARGLKLAQQGSAEEICNFAEIALKNREWSVEMLRDTIQFLQNCGRVDASKLVKDAAKKRFPDAEQFK